MTKKPQLNNSLARRIAVAFSVASLSAVAHSTVFQAEDYQWYADHTTGNTGGAYRQGDVDIEASSDSGGGFNVGWIDAREWLAYENLEVPNNGRYLLKVRVASLNGAKMSVDLDGGSIALAEFDIPATGGWQQWQTLEQEVDISAGTYNLGVFAQTGGWNFNWIEISPVVVVTPTPTPTPIATPIATPIPQAPLFFQAEDYDLSLDSTPGNTGGAYREGDVDIEVCQDDDGGFNVGWWDQGEWLAYQNVHIAQTGNYQIRARVASPSGASVSLDLNAGEISLGDIAIPATGSWQQWQTVTLDTHIDAGNYQLGVFAKTPGFNLNWLEIVPGGSGPTIPQVTWSEEFNSIDPSIWNFEVGGGGWGNNELQYYSDGQNASIEFDAQANSSVLVIEARQETGGQCWWGGNCAYTSTRLNTRHKFSFQYGRIEARMKLPKAQGIWPAFWMLGDNFNTQGWPQGGELDIMEHVGTNNITSGALHGPGYSGATPITGHLVHAQPIEQQYNIYAVEWDATNIHWYVNDINFYSVSKAEVEQFGEWVYDQAYWILLNVAVGGNWPGDPDHTNFSTQKMYVDYIRIYQ